MPGSTTSQVQERLKFEANIYPDNYAFFWVSLNMHGT